MTDHTEAAAMYAEYEAKKAELKKHQEYANRVIKATDGKSMTPVKPLATMGTGGGPLLCDHCKKPIILEGGQFHGVYADKAWKTRQDDKWVSYIKGGMVVESLENDTIRIYHGYTHNPNDCCELAKVARNKAEEAFKSTATSDKLNKLSKFINWKFAKDHEKWRNALLKDVVQTLFGYDPGFGINRPS